MTRIITHQRTQIGILKANGFKNSTITFHYISYGFCLVLSGSILGLILGPMIIPKLFYPSMIAVYQLPVWSPSWNMSFIFLIALIAIFSLAVSNYAVSSISNEKPSEAIKPST